VEIKSVFKLFWFHLIKKTLMCSVLSYSFVVSADDRAAFLEFNGFVESRLGIRTTEDPDQKNTSLGEVRLQLETEKDVDNITFNLVVDFLYDPVMNVYTPDLDKGEGAIDLRQANLVMSPVDFMDIKVGRQILTWGTGDLLFINDLFAKDWNSFLIGRDVEYLKAPTNALKFSMFHDIINVDIVYTPRFSSDRYIDGKRISFFDRSNNTSRGMTQPLIVDKPNSAFTNDELSLRLFRAIGANEVALYYYNGYWKSPAGLSEFTGNGIFPTLAVFGASIRGPITWGIGNIEIGSYESDSMAANDALIRNSEYRFLLGYEQELATELTGSVQYYIEHKRDYSSYVNSLPVDEILDNKNRQVITIRLTKLLLQQNLKLSIFDFYSPTDKDNYFRAVVSYSFSDSLKLESGINYFYGKKPYTFYTQFKNSNNTYASIRYEF
jgi:hypothetical protein